MAENPEHDVWNAAVGDAWVTHNAQFDAILEPFGTAAIDQLALQVGERVIDLGCGVGATTRALAGLVDPGEVVGVDISRPMLAEARNRTEAQGLDNVRFLEADVATAQFGEIPFDVAFSRVGVMFFVDPIAAFANVARALRPDGRLGFVCFQSPEHNPFIVIPVLAAAAHLELPPLPDPNAPGPFSLADAAHTTDILSRAGFTDVVIEPGPDQATLPGAGDLLVLAGRVLEQNPTTAGPLAKADDATRTAALEATAAVLEEHRDGNTISLGAGTWIVTARTIAS